MARKSTPAMRERAEKLLIDAMKHDPDEPDSDNKTWWQNVKIACPDWKNL